MSYPEHGASYEHNPKFIDRMKHAEGGKCGPYRQDGGSIESNDFPALSDALSGKMGGTSTVEDAPRDLGNAPPSTSSFSGSATPPGNWITGSPGMNLQTGKMTLGPSSGPKDIWEQQKGKGD